MDGKNYGGEKGRETETEQLTAARGMRRAWCVLDSSVSCKASQSKLASNPVTQRDWTPRARGKVTMHAWAAEGEGEES